MTIISISKPIPSFVLYGKFNSLIFLSGSAEGRGVEGGGGFLPHDVGTLYTTATLLLFCLFVCFCLFNSPHQLYQLRDQSLVRMRSLVVTLSGKNVPWEPL